MFNRNTVVFTVNILNVWYNNTLITKSQYKFVYYFAVTYFNFSLILCGIASLFQVFVLNLHYRGDEKMSMWVANYILQPLSSITLTKIPGYKYCGCLRDRVCTVNLYVRAVCWYLQLFFIVNQIAEITWTRVMHSYYTVMRKIQLYNATSMVDLELQTFFVSS